MMVMTLHPAITSIKVMGVTLRLDATDNWKMLIYIFYTGLLPGTNMFMVVTLEM